MQTRILCSLALVAAALAGCDSAEPTAQSGAAAHIHTHQSGAARPADRAVDRILLAEARAATARFHRLDAALEAEYVQVSACVAGPDGGMGYHYAKPTLVDGVVDPAAPEILVYAPSPSGGVRLAALEYVVAAPAWDPRHPGAAPSINGVAFEDHRAPEAWHGLGFPHYDLHVWAWEDNPAGVYAPWNPRVSCGG